MSRRSKATVGSEPGPYVSLFVGPGTGRERVAAGSRARVAQPPCGSSDLSALVSPAIGAAGWAVSVLTGRGGPDARATRPATVRATGPDTDQAALGGFDQPEVEAKALAPFRGGHLRVSQRDDGERLVRSCWDPPRRPASRPTSTPDLGADCLPGPEVNPDGWRRPFAPMPPFASLPTSAAGRDRRPHPFHLALA